MTKEQFSQTKDYRGLLLALCASLTLADHIGDVSNEVHEVLKRLEMPAEVLDADWEDVGLELGKLGIRTLWGTELTEV
jgi:hypothetical protein